MAEHPSMDAHSENVAMAAAPPKPTQRLIIKKMVLENFKSYAGQVEIGPFHKVLLDAHTPLVVHDFPADTYVVQKFSMVERFPRTQ